MNGFVSSRSTSTLCVCVFVCYEKDVCGKACMYITKDSVIVYKLFPLTRTSIQIQMVLGEFSATEKRVPFLLAVVHPCTAPGSDAGHIPVAWLWI